MTASTAPPHDLDAEQALLGAAFLNRAAAREVARLGPAAFYREAHRLISSAIARLLEAGSPVDGITVPDELERRGELDSAGGRAYLVTIAGMTTTVTNAPYHARIVAEKAEKRRLLDDLDRARSDLYDGVPTADTVAKLREAIASAGLAVASGTTSSRLVGGGDFAFDAGEHRPPIFGRPGEVLEAEGEPTLIVSPTGIGKTTLAQRRTLARVGLRPAEVLGFPVRPSDRRVLYIAAYRPLQAARSLARMVTPDEREALNERVVFHKGPLPFEIATEPERLVQMAHDDDCGDVVFDSLKDVAVDLVKDEVGSRIARAFQHIVAEGLQLLVLHHQRKAGTEPGNKPRRIDDVYGSTWITAAAGSVVLLWGKPGDPIIELSHLKSPEGEVGPLRVLVDHATGDLSLAPRGSDMLAVLIGAASGLSARDAARLVFGSENDNEIEKARRKLERLVNAGLAHRVDGEARNEPARYFAVDRRGAE